MFDFRYHALSLVAVFVALVVGLLLGVAVGDRGLVSSAERSLRADLRGDVRSAREEAAELREELERHRRYEELTLGRLVRDRLAERRVAVVFLGERSETIFDSVRDAVQRAGGELSLVGTLRRPLELDALSAAAENTQYEAIEEDPSLADDLGRRLGVQLANGGRLLRELRGAILSATSGDVGPTEAVVVVRTPVEPLEEEDDQEHVDGFVEGLVDGIRAGGVPIVGVEETTTEPSQIPWYLDRGIASVDNVDQVPGRASLVYALAGEADGAYGIKPTRDAFIPDALVRTP